MKNPNEIDFVCPLCKTHELIPTDIVQMLDSSDQVGVDTTFPPRFDCQKCNGMMEPTFYISVNGIIFSNKN
jgi:hypothetical protein